MKEIQLTQGKVALVDDEDFEELNRFKWFAHNNHGYTFYAMRTVDEKAVRMHRVVLGVTKGQIIDHIDGNGLNNQKSNLRVSTKCQNNSHLLKKNPRNTSGYRGVYPNRKNKSWIAQISFENNQVYLGSFKTPEEAAKVFDKKAKELFGEFCGKLNFE